jgi:hypothetical protein
MSSLTLTNHAAVRMDAAGGVAPRAISKPTSLGTARSSELLSAACI